MTARTQVGISTDLVGDLFTISVWDVATGNVLTSYKAPGSSGGGGGGGGLVVPPHCIDLVRDHYLLCTYQNSPTLHVWNLAKKDHLFAKMILPGVVTALAVSGDGAYCLAAIEAKIYIWQISSGHLLNVLERHYQRVAVVRITADLSRFISAGDDGLVIIWDFARCIVEREDFAVTGGTSSQFEPLRTLHNSSAKINDLHLNDLNGNGGRGHFAVASEDRCVRVYSLEWGQLLVTVLYDAPVRSVVMDRAERFLFAGLQSGDIIQTALSDWEAVGRTGTADKLIDLTTTPATPDAAVEEKEEEEEEEVIEVEGELPSKQEGEPKKKRAKKTTYSSKQSSPTPKVPRAVFSGHTASVTCLAVSIDGLGLLSGSADRSSKLWHIKSRQSMRTCSAAYRGALSNLLVVPAPGGLFLYDSLEAQMSSLMEPAGQIATDVSLKSAAGGASTSRGQGSSSTAYKVPLFLNSTSSSGRPATYEALMKRAAQPPPPIVPFKREIYRPGSKTNAALNNGGPWKAFERGIVMVANDDCSGQELWPWEGGWAMPSEADIERIFTGSSSFSSRPRLSLEGGSGSRSRQGKGSKLVNGVNGGGDANGNDQEDEEEGDGEMAMSEQSKDELIAQLRHQNEQLYHLAVDEVFRSSITRKSSAAAAEEDEEAEKVPSGSS